MAYPAPVDVIGAKSTIYLECQSGFRQWLTEFVDNHRIPFLFSYFRNHRLNNVRHWSKFFETGERSPFDVHV